MSTDRVHPSAADTNTRPNRTESGDYTDDPSLPPQRHAGSVGLGPNYPIGPGLGDKLGGVAEEIKGKILKKPEVVEHGHERRTGELMRKERERDNAADPFKTCGCSKCWSVIRRQRMMLNGEPVCSWGGEKIDLGRWDNLCTAAGSVTKYRCRYVEEPPSATFTHRNSQLSSEHWELSPKENRESAALPVSFLRIPRRSTFAITNIDRSHA